MTLNRACPSCGGKDRFYYASRKQVWQCRRCDYTEAGSGNDVEQIEEVSLTPEEKAQAALAYNTTADFCANLLWGDDGRNALKYLHLRGFTDDTIKAAQLGFHPQPASNGGSTVAAALSYNASVSQWW